jgi:hypothetical protein
MFIAEGQLNFVFLHFSLFEMRLLADQSGNAESGFYR